MLALSTGTTPKCAVFARSLIWLAQILRALYNSLKLKLCRARKRIHFIHWQHKGTQPAASQLIKHGLQQLIQDSVRNRKHDCQDANAC